MPLPLIHITAAYSNAVVAAILPHVSDCAQKLELPITQPVMAQQIARINISPDTNYFGCGLWLTNHYWFAFSFGRLNGFHSPDDWFAVQDFDNVQRFIGQETITTNDAINLARATFVKLGCNSADFHVNDLPATVEGPFDAKSVGHIPYCRVTWESPDGRTPEERTKGYTVQFDIDLNHHRVVGMFLSGQGFWLPNPHIDVVPETEQEYRKHIQGRMFVNTNAPALFKKAE